MPEPITSEPLYEMLKGIQDRLGRIEGRLTSLEDRMGRLDNHTGNLIRIYADLVEDGARRDRDHTELRRRVERIERRLDLADPSP